MAAEISHAAAAERAEEESIILDAVEKFLEREVAPYARDLEKDDIWPEDIVEGMKELGLFGAIIPEEYGGLGLGAATYARIVERMARVWMSITGIYNSHLIMASAVVRHGTEAQRREWLPKFASGEIRGGLALTEPDGGTDLQSAVRTTARHNGSGYVVNGTKTWISNGIHGQCFALLVKTDPDAMPRHRGMSLFLAEKGEGFTVSRRLEKLGYKGIDSAELVFEDYFVPEDRLIGGEEGRGLQHALGGLELGRINIAARGVGVAQASLDEAVRYAQIRRSFGKPICEHQAIQIKLADRWVSTQVWESAPPSSSSGRPPPSTGASAATWRRGWRSSRVARPRSSAPSSRCGCTAATATPRSSTWSASTGTRRCWPSGRARTSFSASSSPASSSPATRHEPGGARGRFRMSVPPRVKG